jgi:hypothetical protein
MNSVNVYEKVALTIAKKFADVAVVTSKSSRISYMAWPAETPKVTNAPNPSDTAATSRTDTFSTNAEFGAAAIRASEYRDANACECAVV